MNTTTAHHTRGQRIFVNIADTVGQEDAIKHNGSPVFLISVTASATNIGGDECPGFGRVCGGAVDGYEVLYFARSEVAGR